MTYINYILDFEEAVADLSGCFDSAFSKAFAQFDIPYDRSRLEEYVSTPMNELFEKHYRGCTCKYRDFVIMFMGAFDDSFGKAVLRPGIRETVSEMHGKGIRFGIVSECYEMYVHRLLSENGLDACFLSVIGMDRTAVARPDPYVLNLCLRELGAERNDTSMIASSERNISMCQKAGVRILPGFSE